MSHPANLKTILNSTKENHIHPVFPSEMPVSYNHDSIIVSRFGDICWDMSSTSNDATTPQIFHFYQPAGNYFSDLALVIREQQKSLLWCHINHGRTRALSTLHSANYALAHFCKAAEEKSVDLFTYLSDTNCIMDVATRVNTLYVQATKACIKTLWRHRKKLNAPLDFPLGRILEALNEETRTRPKDKQTPLIPSSIYCNILVSLENHVDSIEKMLDSSSSDVITLSTSEVKQYQVLLMLVVAAYTGMRVGEVSMLPLKNVLVEFEHNGSTHYEIHGYSYKLNKGLRKSCTWITSHQGERAIRLAQRFAELIYIQHAKPIQSGQTALLFPSILNCYRRLANHDIKRAMILIRDRVCPVIQQSDIDELNKLELARDWALDGIEVGEKWHLAFHQLRRSLAVYAHRSGMVSLPALKTQLQHITQEMSSYYANGFSRAVNLVFDKEHFSNEWKYGESESSYHAYVLGVLFGEDNYLGKAAQQMSQTILFRNRDDTLRLFRENKIAYKETPLGGCVSTEECKVDPLEPIPYNCLESNCINQVIFKKRLDYLIKNQEIAVAALQRDDAGSVEHRLELSHLENLRMSRERHIKG